MSRRRTRGKKKKNHIVIGLIAVLIVAVAGFAGVNLYLNSGGKAPDPAGTETFVSVEIPSGTGTGQIISLLEEQNLIKSASAFKMIAKSNGYDGKFKAGSYSLSPSMDAETIMEILVGGNSDTKRFTVPEGLTVAQTADKLAGDQLINRDAFMEEVANGSFDQKFIEFLPEGEGRLEGFLFPETYDVFTTATEHDIVNRMLNQFDLIYKEEYYTRASELGYDLNQIITIASMIERETMVSDEMGKVASVIYNRLEINMPLQIDATVQYALGEHKDRLSIADTKVESPYNTYENTGLPPGPICSPGESAIKAALYPEDTDYFYYVLGTEGDGTHAFSNSYSQFLTNKKKYINSL